MSNLQKMTAKDNHGESYSINLEYPDHCPMCGNKVTPLFVTARIEKTDVAVKSVYVMFECPQQNCGSGFIGMYRRGVDAVCTLKWLTPEHTPLPVIFKALSTLSARFIDVYRQATSADDLPDLQGMGLRKACEILVKDYLIASSPADEAAIKSEPLRAAICRIENAKIKKIAESGTWLDNDELHYGHAWSPQDVDDMKAFLTSVTAFIQADLVADAQIAASLSRSTSALTTRPEIAMPLSASQEGGARAHPVAKG